MDKMNIGIFAGRRHHADKLMPLYNRFIADGHNAEFFYTANSVNIDPPAEFLLNTTVSTFDLRQLVIEASLDWTELDWDNLFKTYTRIGVPLFEIANATIEQYQLVCMFAKYIEERKPDLVLLLHENNFWTKTIANMCHTAGVKCVSFQEGILRRDYGFEITERAARYSDELFVWSEWDKQLYIKYGVDESKIVVGGAFHLDGYYNRDQPPDRSDDKFATLALTLSSLWLGEMENDIKWFCQLCKNMSITPIVSCHPFDLQMGISQLVEQHGGVFWQSDTLDAVMLSDFVLTQFSTIAVESALLNKPVFYLNRSEHDEFEQQLFMEIIDKTTDQSKLVEYLKEVSGEPTNQEMLEAYKMDGKRTDFVMEKLYALSSL